MARARGIRLVLLISVCLSAFALAMNLTSSAVQGDASRSAPTSLPTSQSTTVGDVERLRAIARDLLNKKSDEKSVDRAAQLLRQAAETENQAAQAAKSALDEQKLKADLSQSESARRSEEWKSLITIVTPLFTTIVLALTLVQQSRQFKEQRIEASADARRKLDADEDLRWNEAIKVLSGQKHLSPEGVLLATFSQSKRYGARARDLALQLLTTSSSIDEFSATLGNLFEPVNWDNLKWILDADRSIYAIYRRLDLKSSVEGKETNDKTLLTETERVTWDRVVDEIEILATKVGPLLTSRRPANLSTLDLSATTFWRCDWKGVDLSSADLTNCFLYTVDLEGANLSGITRFQSANVSHCAWWNAARISPQFLEYLLPSSAYKPELSYGSLYRPIAQADYDAALLKLKQASSIR